MAVVVSDGGRPNKKVKVNAHASAIIMQAMSVPLVGMLVMRFANNER